MAVSHAAHIEVGSGLSAEQVAERTARGAVNHVTSPSSRSVGDILRANVLTRFNAIVGTMMLLILLVGPYQDAVFGLVMVANAVVGIVQELRSKRALDGLRLVTAPTARVIRDGSTVDIPASEVVVDDLVVVGRGDQLMIDGTAVESEGLELDQSILTGESDPIPKAVGDSCLSGSTVLAGRGVVVATVVGDDSYAARLAEEAHRFRLARSELRNGIDVILRAVTWLLVPTGLLVAWAQYRAGSERAGEAIGGAIAATVGMIPQGLVLLTSVAMAVGIIRLSRNRVLVQELAAIECLARVDVVCFDKTGTLTEGVLTLTDIDRLDDDAPVETALRSLCRSDPASNATLLAIDHGLPDGDTWDAEARVAFRSDRRWSGADFGIHGAWVLGAVQAIAPNDREISARVRSHAESGGRVLVLARSDGLTEHATAPREVDPAAIVVLADTIRPQVGKTLAYFAAQGVSVKVLSGDDVDTVAAVCRQAGIEGEFRDASAFPDVTAIVEEGTVFGRVEPDRKRQMVAELQRTGHVVAMVGDGVNDVPSMKQADIAVAMGSGADATRTVGQVVLADSDFDRLPDVVAEGRRVIFNIERVAKLYLTKTVYALLLAVAVGIAGVTFPLLPRHVTIVGSLTIGIPSFWLALEPGAARARPGFVSRVLSFAAPSGLLVAGAGFGAFWLANGTVTTIETQTTTMLTLTGVGLLVMVAAVLPLSRLDRALVAAMIGCLALVSLVPPLRDFYAVDLPPPLVFMAAVGIVALAGVVLWAAHHLIDDVVRPRLLGSADAGS